MRQTIEFLLALPEEERSRLEEAENYTHTMASPAPHQERAAGAPATVAVTWTMGSTEAVALLCRQGARPAVLNFAHGYNCGGGFEHSAGSQEEDIFRKTSLFLSLWPHRRSDDGPGVLARGKWIGDFDEVFPRKEPFYPHTECGGVYSPNVRLARQLDVHSLPLWGPDGAEPVPTFGVLTVAAQDVGRERHFRPELLREKVRTVLHMAASHGHDAVVLGAFGCGYFHNPPQQVAGAFAELLKGEFAGCFRAAVFAIPHRGGHNLESFTKHFPLSDPAKLEGLF